MIFFDTKECEWSDTSLAIAGANVTKLRGVKYGEKADKELLFAQGDMAISIQKGNRSGTGELKILKGALDDINRAVKLSGGKNILDAEFDIVITYRPKGLRALSTDILVRCQATEYQKGWEQGAKMMEITIPILFLDIKES